MPCRNDPVFGERATPTPGEQELDRALMSELGAARPLLFADDCTAIAREEARLSEQAFELAAEHRLRRGVIEKNGKLEARGGGIQNEDSVRHDSPVKFA